HRGLGAEVRSSREALSNPTRGSGLRGDESTGVAGQIGDAVATGAETRADAGARGIHARGGCRPARRARKTRSGSPAKESSKKAGTSKSAAEARKTKPKAAGAKKASTSEARSLAKGASAAKKRTGSSKKAAKSSPRAKKTARSKKNLV